MVHVLLVHRNVICPWTIAQHGELCGHMYRPLCSLTEDEILRHQQMEKEKVIQALIMIILRCGAEDRTAK